MQGQTEPIEPTPDWVTGASIQGPTVHPKATRSPAAQTTFREPAEWVAFLADLTGASVGLSPRHAQAFRALWTCLRVALGPRLPPPQVEAGADGAIKLIWSRPNFYAEIELHAEDDAGRCRHEWFFRDRSSDIFDGSREPESGAPGLRFLGLMRHAITG